MSGKVSPLSFSFPTPTPLVDSFASGDLSLKSNALCGGVGYVSAPASLTPARENEYSHDADEPITASAENVVGIGTQTHQPYIAGLHGAAAKLVNRRVFLCRMCHRHEADDDGGICEQCESIKMDVEQERMEG